MHQIEKRRKYRQQGSKLIAEPYEVIICSTKDPLPAQRPGLVQNLEYEFCRNCDGTGSYEGGVTILTPCEICDGTGQLRVVTFEQPNYQI